MCDGVWPVDPLHMQLLTDRDIPGVRQHSLGKADFYEYTLL